MAAECLGAEGPLGIMRPGSRPARPTAGVFRRCLLLEGVKEIVIDYYGVLAGESDAEWHME